MALRTAMQHLFTHLAFSKRKYYSPVMLASACANDPPGFFPLDSPVREQNDANEFFNLLTDRLGDCFPGVSLTDAAATDPSPEARAVKVPDLMQASMGGALVHQLIGGAACGHRKDRAEPFMCISLEVNGKPTIIDSLSAFVAGELLAGDNAFYCDTCGKTVGGGVLPMCRGSRLLSKSSICV